MNPNAKCPNKTACRIAESHTIHGRETRQKRLDTSYKLAELSQLEAPRHRCGLFPEGTGRTRRRKPKHFSAEAEKYRYLSNLMKQHGRDEILKILHVYSKFTR